MRVFLIALGFLTILPLYPREVSEEELGSSGAGFPVVGLLKGAIIVATVVLLRGTLSDGVLAVVCLFVYVLTTGAFHLDGLSDTFDGIGSRGDTQRKLAAMKDPSVGPVGAVSIVMALVGKYVLMEELILSQQMAALVLFPVAGTMAMVTGAWRFRAARAEGLGSIFISHTTGGVFARAVLLCLVITVLSGLLFRALPEALGAMLLAVTTGYLFGRHLEDHFGGHTGDTLGALAEVTEVAFLFFYVVI